MDPSQNPPPSGTGDLPPAFCGSLFSGAYDRNPRPVAWSGDELVERLSDYRVVHRSKKEAQEAWSPASYAPGATRRKENVREVSCLVLDIDDGTSLDKVWAAFPEYAKLLYTTWSHRAAAPKSRLLLPLRQPVPGTHWYQSWIWANTRAAMYGIRQDPSCKDSSRLYFLPAVPGPIEYNEAECRTDLTKPPLFIPWGSLPDPAVVVRAANQKRSRQRQIARASVGAERKTDYTDPEVRERVAAVVEARLVGDGIDRRATRGWCPACGRQSVYWYILSRFAPAKCDHARTCGWRGSLEQLDNR